MQEDRLYHIDRALRTTLRIAALVTFVLLILASLSTSWKEVFTYGFYITGCVCLVCIIGRICLSPFVKSEEEEEFEQKVDYILQKRAKEKAPNMPISSDFSPLRDLTSFQEERVINILRGLPPHASDPEQINMALMAQYLTALERLGKIDLTDKKSLRTWVAQVTQKNVPDSSHFNDAIRNVSLSKVAKARRKLESYFWLPVQR